MEVLNRYFRNNYILYAYLIVSAIIIVGALGKILHWGLPSVILAVGVLASTVIWVLVLIDIINNKVYNKSFWLISIIFIHCISIPIYLIQRNRLLRLGSKFA